MKTTGMVRNLDKLGRLVIPKETRKVFDINEGDPIEIFTDGDKIILKKYNPGCHCCGNVGDLKEVMGLKICTDCLKEFSKAVDLIKKSRMREDD